MSRGIQCPTYSNVKRHINGAFVHMITLDHLTNHFYFAIVKLPIGTMVSANHPIGSHAS
jgi:hypothetical protein